MSISKSLEDFISSSRRVLNISYKPTSSEFNRSAKVILLGILLIGVAGFIVSLVIGYITGTPV